MPRRPPPGSSTRTAPRLDRIPRRTWTRQGYPTRQQLQEQGGGWWPRHRPIVPGGCPPSIVGAGAFHDRVRDGNGWVRPARATEATIGYPWAPGSPPAVRLVDVRRSCRPRVVGDVGAEPSAISTAPLRRSPAVHARPIDQVVYLGPYPIGSVGTLISGRASRLDAFSGYPCRTSATRRCRWRDNRSTGGPSVPVLSYWGRLPSRSLRPRRIETELSHDVLNPARVPL